MPDDSVALTSTSFQLSGVTTRHDVRKVADKVSEVPDVGAVAVELVPDGPARLILKHKAAVQLDSAAIDDAVRRAGAYAVVTPRLS